ncbi:MAG TPA: ABC transporter permease [Vicinamibacterales bacterium]|nr:ABC transporter permease [Vicinamibacterales bacterium]
MTTLWAKAAADVWRARSRTILVVIAIAIGLSGFLAVLSTYTILRRELDRGYLATNPASAVLRTTAVDEALLTKVIARDDVDDADARRVVTASLRTGDGAWRRVMLFVLRDFTSLRINTVTPEGGEWPPSPGGMSIERDAFQVAKARIGDLVAIRMSDGREHRLRVAGGVHDPGQAQARMENMVYAYITPETLVRLGEMPTLDRLQLLVSGNRLDEAHIRRVAEDVKASLERDGHRVRRIDVPTPGQHPHTVIMGFLLLVMAAFGFLALVLSGVIVVNLLFATMANERRQVGVMKAIGGTRGQIAAIYLAEAALFGAAAIALASPAGIWGGRVLSRYFAVLLNFDLATLAVPGWVYLLVAFIGLVVPIAAAAYPVAVGTRITVREAIAAAGVDLSTFGGRRLDRVLAALPLARGPLLLGVRNSLRRRVRLALTLVTLTLAGAFFISALSFRTSMIATFDQLFGAGTFGADDRYAFDQHMLMIYIFLILVGGVLAAVGALGLMTTTSLNVLDRRRELGVLRAIGATPRMVGGIVVLEAVFVVVIAWGLGVLLAWPITAALGTLMSSLLTLIKVRSGVLVSLAPAAVAGWLGIAVALAVVSSLAPAWSASRRSIREAISYE